MHLDTYKCEPISLPTLTNAFCFESTGPNGTFRKIVHFHPIRLAGNAYVNLSFGDWDEENKRIDDEAVSNNGDTNKVLATVALAALDYSYKYDNTPIFVMGTCYARTRLYQMALNAHRLTVERLFSVSGLMEGEWQEFVRGRNYKAFMLSAR